MVDKVIFAPHTQIMKTVEIYSDPENMDIFCVKFWQNGLLVRTFKLYNYVNNGDPFLFAVLNWTRYGLLPNDCNVENCNESRLIPA